MTGNPQGPFWVQVHEFLPDTENSERHDNLIVIVSLENPESQIESALLGRQILGTIQKEYFKSSGETFNALKTTLEKVSTEFGGKVLKLDIVASAFVDGIIYSGVLGMGQVAILRDGMLAKILIGKSGVIVASGYPQMDDILILGTQELLEDVSFGVLKAGLEKKDVASIEATLNSIIHSKENESKLGAAVWVFSEKAKIETFPQTPKEEQPTKVVFEKNRRVETLKGLMSRLAGLIPKREIFVRSESNEVFENPRKKTTITVGIILLILLLISIVFGARQRNSRLSRSKYEARLNQAVHDFDESISLLSLNPERSRELYLESRNLAQGLKDEGVKDQVLDELVIKISNEQGQVLKEFSVEIQDFVDLGLLSGSFEGSDLASSGEDIFILDKDRKKVIRVSIVNKKAEVVAGPESVESGSLISAYEERLFVLTDSGVKELGDKNSYVVDKDWEGEVLAYTYAGNLYLLNKVDSQVYRYPGIEAGFGARQNWFGEGVSPDLSTSVSWVIDGNVWILLSGSRILKFTLGSPQVFAISGLGSPLASPPNIYTNENLESIYILDPQNSRIVVVDKKGEYKAQYVSDGLKNATDLVVSEENKRVVFLEGGNLKSIELSHF